MSHVGAICASLVVLRRIGRASDRTNVSTRNRGEFSEYLHHSLFGELLMIYFGKLPLYLPHCSDQRLDQGTEGYSFLQLTSSILYYSHNRANSSPLGPELGVVSHAIVITGSAVAVSAWMPLRRENRTTSLTSRQNETPVIAPYGTGAPRTPCRGKLDGHIIHAPLKTFPERWR
jgi:hypothetical protein